MQQRLVQENAPLGGSRPIILAKDPPIASGTSAVLPHLEITPQRPDWLAGAPGFEPGNGGIKLPYRLARPQSAPDHPCASGADQSPGDGPGGSPFASAASSKTVSTSGASNPVSSTSEIEIDQRL